MTSEGSNMYMPVAPAYGYGNNGSGFGFGDGNGWWLILLLLVFGGGWGMGGFGGAAPFMMGGMGGGFELYPWLNNSQHIADGFRDQQIQSTLAGIQSGITSGFGDVQNALCAGFAGVNAGVANGFAQAEIANNARQMANMQTQFGIQSAIQGGFAQNAAGTADLKYTVATEACADRNAISQGIRDVMENCNRNNQAVLDKLCALELDGVKSQLAQAQRENVGLQNQLNMASMAASQATQTGNIRDAIISELRSCPIPAQPVYGNQPIFTCNWQNPNVGCGCNGAFMN